MKPVKAKQHVEHDTYETSHWNIKVHDNTGQAVNAIGHFCIFCVDIVNMSAENDERTIYEVFSITLWVQ